MPITQLIIIETISNITYTGSPPGVKDNAENQQANIGKSLFNNIIYNKYNWKKHPKKKHGTKYHISVDLKSIIFSKVYISAYI